MSRSTSPTSDPQATRRAAELETFLTEHYRRVVGSVALICGNRHAAEDAVQEALATSWRRRDEPVDRLVAWVTVVAANEARQRLRRAGAEERALGRLAGKDPSVVDATAPDDPTPVDPELVDALASLPEREREAAVLHYVHDASVADTAAAMGVADGTVKTLLSRARTHLAERLGPQGGQR